MFPKPRSLCFFKGGFPTIRGTILSVLTRINMYLGLYGGPSFSETTELQGTPILEGMEAEGLRVLKFMV